MSMNSTILISETDEDIRGLVTFILEQQGFAVEPLMSEKNAVQTIRDLSPCAILLDVVRMNQEGTNLCRQIKETEGMMDIPVIVLSTQAEAMTLKGSYADEVILKPFDIDDLIDVVKKTTGQLSLVGNFVLEY
jgi:two-component system phosphate regulon response regulator PhoB